MNLKSEISSGANKVYLAVVWLLLLSNLLGALYYSAFLVFTFISNDTNTLSLHLHVPLYFINVFALYLLLKPDSLGFKILILTSVLSCVASWYSGMMLADIFKVFGTAEFYMFALSATFYPFVGVALVYIVGKDQMVRQPSETPQLQTDTRDRSNKQTILIVTLVTLGVLSVPVILFLLFILSLDFAPGGFQI